MSYTLSLGSVANVRTITSAWSSLTEALDSHDSVSLDLADLVDVDLSLVQLVEAARVHALHTHRTLRLTAPANATVKALLHRAGFLTEPDGECLEFWLHGECPQ